MNHYITPTGIASAWVANELNVVKERGIPVMLHSLRPSRQQFFVSKWAKQLDDETNVIYAASPITMAISVLMAPFLFRGKFVQGLANALFGARESFRNRVAALFHFFVACHWARDLRKKPVSHIHSQWIHSGGTVGMYGAWLLGVSFSFTGHAADLFRERVALTDKVRRAAFIVCISHFHRKFYKELGARDEQLHLVYCGIDLSLFVAKRLVRQSDQPVVILSSGRLVEKKGFAVLLDACRILADRGVKFRCVIGGDGPLAEVLRERNEGLGLISQVTITGKPLTQEELPGFMHGGHIYALPCVWAADGDVDGLPQMLMEAMACGLPAVSTRLVGIPDLIENECSGLVIESGSAPQLAAALERLILDETLAGRLAEEGCRVVRERFEIHLALRPLIELFRQRLVGPDGLREPQPAINQPLANGGIS